MKGYRSAYPVVFSNQGDCYLCAKRKPSYVLTTLPAQNDIALCADCVAWWRESGEGIREVRLIGGQSVSLRDPS